MFLQVKNTFPISIDDLSCEHQKFSSLATSEFMKCSFKDEKGEYLEKLEVSFKYGRHTHTCTLFILAHYAY